MTRQGELLGQAFDRVILYEDHYVRGREPGEIMRRFREGVSRGRRTQHVQEIFGAVKAIDAALAMLQPGDLLLLQADTIDETVDYVRQYRKTHHTAREITLAEALATAPVPVRATVEAVAAESAVASVAAESQRSAVAAFAS